MNRRQFRKALRQDLAERNPLWETIPRRDGPGLQLAARSTYIAEPPFFEGFSMQPAPPRDDQGRARARASSATRSPPTTSARPARSRRRSPAGHYLQEQRRAKADFNSYGARRGNHEVMMRGTFANVRIKNLMVRQADGTREKAA